jgi:hypothetical protein
MVAVANIDQGYYHTPEAAASGLTKRQQREAILARNDAKKEYCPRGWTACLIDDTDDEPYEVCSSPT